MKSKNRQPPNHLSSSIESYETEELVSSLLSFLYASQHAACNRGSGRLLYSSHHHAQMARLHNHRDALWLQHLHDGVGDIFRKAFLDL